MELYEIRNQIAHGDLRSEGIDVSTVIEDFFRSGSSLARDCAAATRPAEAR